MTEKADEYAYVVQAFAGLSGSGWLRQPCPCCEEMDGHRDDKRSLGYNTETGGYNCFRCKMKGRLPDSWRRKLEVEEQVAAASPAELLPPEPADGYMPVFDGEGLEARCFDAARAYIIERRGIDFNVARAMLIGAALEGKLAGRVIVPVPYYGWHPGAPWRVPWQGWVARDYTGFSPLPYLYPKRMQRPELLYNEPALYVETDLPVLVCEGVFDAAVSFPDSVACLGKPLQAHVAKLRRARRPVVVCLDGDAWEEGWSLAMTLRHYGVCAGNLRLPPKTDPEELGRGREWLMSEAKRCCYEG